MVAVTSVIELEAIKPLPRSRTLGVHGNTVMGISVAAQGSVSTIDYDGNWSVRREPDLALVATGRMKGRGRGVALSPKGTHLAALLALRDHSDTRYAYDVFVDDVSRGSDTPIAIPGERVVDAAWTPDGEFLILTNALGVRVHHRDGTYLRGDESPKGWAAARVTADAGRLYFMRQKQLGCLELDSFRALPAPDTSRFAPPSNSHGWDSDGLALSRAGDLLTTGRFKGGIYVWDLASGDAVAELCWAGPQVFSTKAAFSPNGAHLVASFHHVITAQSNGRVTHVLYDLHANRSLGKLETETRLTGFHSKACFSADGRKLYISEGSQVHSCEVLQ